jgi:nucleotide-binding universal stress UspA family protein
MTMGDPLSDAAAALAQMPARLQALVVPWDGSRLAQRAVPVTAELARRVHAELVVLLSVVANPSDLGRRRAELSAVADSIDGVLTDPRVVVEDDPADAIVDTMLRLPDSLVCMATHGRGRSAALLGSVALDVLVKGRAPALLVGPFQRASADGRGVVVCVDETPTSGPLLWAALQWARLTREPLTVVTVAEAVPPPIDTGPVRRRFGPDGDVDLYLSLLVEPIRDVEPDVRTCAVFSPIGPARGILDHITAHPPDSLVLGTHARSGLDRLAHGSVAASVVFDSPVPVLVVPSTDEP